MASSQQSEFQRALEDLHESEQRYKEQFIKYAVGMLVAELTVVGFLLQNTATKALIGGKAYKTLLILSLLFSGVTVLLYMAEKRFSALYQKSNMYLIQAKLATSGAEIEVPPFDVRFTDEMIASFSQSKPRELKKFVRYNHLEQLSFKAAEYSFAMSVASAVLFLGYLILSF